ncbi:MAG: hypothetical protein CMJ32_06795 [Phycisphaerae bacterium]|nr:hypothetical protein [Phycisphaerae bacterium]
MPAEADDPPVVIGTFSDDLEATLVVSRLGAAGIKAVVSGGITGAFRAKCPGSVDVLVNESSLVQAREVLGSMDHGDPNLQDVEHPDGTDPLEPPDHLDV